MSRQDELQPSVSIVMPTLNQAGFIVESVRSVMQQDVPGLELLVADGGSTDGTVEQLAQLSAAFPGRIRWTSESDAGPAQAVHALVSRARGHWVGWLNSDDLYTAGAVQRALTQIARSDSLVMVYGEAEHIDADGRTIGPYPTRPPQTPLAAFADGCHICQPTVFFNRQTYLELGGLDTSLRTAFDFDFWWRLLKAHPHAVGYVPDLQARSRLHAGTITSRMREAVALEGLRVVHRHLGQAPPHWLLTHFSELKAAHPFHPEPIDLAPHMTGLIDAAARWLSAEGVQTLRDAVAGDLAVRLSSPFVYATIEFDGWAGAVLEVRLRQPGRAIAALRLHGRHASRRIGRLHLTVTLPDGRELVQKVGWRRRFALELPVADQRPDARIVFRIRSNDVFVPAQTISGSTDGRLLAYLVERIEAVPAP